MNTLWSNNTDTQIMNFGTRYLIGLKLWPLYARPLVSDKSYRASLDLLGVGEICLCQEWNSCLAQWSQTCWLQAVWGSHS